jgi:hypothetical protein
MLVLLSLTKFAGLFVLEGEFPRRFTKKKIDVSKQPHKKPRTAARKTGKKIGTGSLGEAD